MHFYATYGLYFFVDSKILDFSPSGTNSLYVSPNRPNNFLVFIK